MLDWLTLSSDLVMTALAALPRQLAIIIGVSLFLKALPRLSASNRHCVWSWTTVTVALVPVFTWLLPKWSVVPANLGVFDAELVHTVYLLAASWSPLLDETIIVTSDSPYGAFSWTTAIVAAWLIFVLVSGSSLLFSWLGLARFQRGRLPVVDGPMCERLQAMQRLAGVETFVGLFSSFRCSLPMTWGFFKPAIHLPSDADDWPYGRLDAVLLHELAHIRRGDAMTNLSLRICCILNWYNPLVWYSAKKAWLTQEQACDDFACARMRSSQYAQHLLQVAANLSPRSKSFAPAALGISASEQLSLRLTSILDTRRDRQAASPRFAFLTFGVLAWLGMVVCVLSLYPVEPTSADGLAARSVSVESSVLEGAHPKPGVNAWEDFLVQTIVRFHEGRRPMKTVPQGTKPAALSETLEPAPEQAPPGGVNDSALEPTANQVHPPSLPVAIAFAPLVSPSPLSSGHPPVQVQSAKPAAPPASAEADPPAARPVDPQIDWRSLQRQRGVRRNKSVVLNHHESLCLRYAKLSPFDQAKYGSLQEFLKLNRVHLDADAIRELLERLKTRSF